MRKVVLFILFLFSFQFVYAQKIQRAIDALKETKYDKALELFDDLIRKDAEDVAAIIGKGVVYKKAIDANLAIPNELELKIIIAQLIRTNSIFESLSSSDLAFINSAFGVSNTEDINFLSGQLSNILWIKYVSFSNEIDSVEVYKRVFAVNETLKNKANSYLSELYYKKIENDESLSSFKNYLSNFPNSKFKAQVLKKIEFLEFNEIALSKDAISLEKYLQRYPLSQYKDSIQRDLARLYFAAVASDISSKSNIKSGIEKLKKLPPSTLSKKYIDSCNNFIFIIEKEEAIASGDLTSLNKFLDTYSIRNKTEIKDVVTLRNLKWKEKLENETSPNLSELSLFMKASAIQQASIDPIINKINESISVRLKQAIDDYVREEIDKRSPFDAEDKKAALVGLIYNKLAIIVSISNKSIYDYLKGKIPTDSEKILEGFVSSIGFEQMFSMNTIYFKANGEFGEFIETASINSSGEISRMIYEFVGNSFVEFPQIKVAFPIFDAIKKRYAITAFSTPQVKRTDERGYKVFLYGYLKADMPCCPSYQIDMIYTKVNNTLTPVTAISIERAYQNITMTISLNDYQRIDKQMLINAD